MSLSLERQGTCLWITQRSTFALSLVETTPRCLILIPTQPEVQESHHEDHEGSISHPWTTALVRLKKPGVQLISSAQSSSSTPSPIESARHDQEG